MDEVQWIVVGHVGREEDRVRLLLLFWDCEKAKRCKKLVRLLVLLSSGWDEPGLHEICKSEAIKCRKLESRILYRVPWPCVIQMGH